MFAFRHFTNCFGTCSFLQNLLSQTSTRYHIHLRMFHMYSMHFKRFLLHMLLLYSLCLITQWFGWMFGFKIYARMLFPGHHPNWLISNKQRSCNSWIEMIQIKPAFWANFSSWYGLLGLSSAILVFTQRVPCQSHRKFAHPNSPATRIQNL